MRTRGVRKRNGPCCPGGRLALLAAAAIFLSEIPCVAPGLALPPGFVRESVGGGPGDWDQPLGIVFAPDGRAYVWERAGRLWQLDADGQKSAEPVLEISDEVGSWGDFGLLSIALDPEFLSNGYVYLLYTVDRHHLLHAGTAGYDPERSEYFAASIGRLTRYTLEAASDFSTTDYASRLVLLGASARDGIPILHRSHGPGSVLFGSDGSLLVSTGDGASFDITDVGSGPGSYYAQGLADGIIAPEENVGSYRSQLLGSRSGKILRIDPASGAGLQSNPFYDAADPNSAASTVWALGVRNAYRVVRRPATGSQDPADGDPGTLYFGDVGWDRWEEIHIADGPGINFGWPNFEGIELQARYTASRTPHPEAPNPLFGEVIPGRGVCEQPFLSFSDLLIGSTRAAEPFFPNPCDPNQAIPDSWSDGQTLWRYWKFVHRRPAIDYGHEGGPARWSSWDGQQPQTVLIGEAFADASGRRVPGPQFGGNTSTAGVFYTGGPPRRSYPAEYLGRYFHGDAIRGQWIRTFAFDVENQLESVADFDLDAGRVLHMTTHPRDGEVYYVTLLGNVWRIRYVGAAPVPALALTGRVALLVCLLALAAAARFARSPRRPL